MGKNVDSEITCPYCGYRDLDSWECDPEQGKQFVQECGKCHRDFDVVVEIFVEYTSIPKNAARLIEKG